MFFIYNYSNTIMIIIFLVVIYFFCGGETAFNDIWNGRGPFPKRNNHNQWKLFLKDKTLKASEYCPEDIQVKKNVLQKKINSLNTGKNIQKLWHLSHSI